MFEDGKRVASWRGGLKSIYLSSATLVGRVKVGEKAATSRRPTPLTIKDCGGGGGVMQDGLGI